MLYLVSTDQIGLNNLSVVLDWFVSLQAVNNCIQTIFSGNVLISLNNCRSIKPYIYTELLNYIDV